MDKFKQFPKGTIKKNYNYYGWAFVCFMLIIIGLVSMINKEFTGRDGKVVFTENGAVIVGLIFLCFGVYSLYHIIFRAVPEEQKITTYHQLNDFKENILGYKTIFKVNESALPSTRTVILVYYYILEIELNKQIDTIINIKQRDKLEVFFWKIGLTRVFDVLTGNYYFDSKYRVKCEHKNRFRQLFNSNVINLLENFDRDYPPIRTKNGSLEITSNMLRYVEGPYSSDQRILDPHRGNIENLFKELIKIITEIERSMNERGHR